MIDMTLEMGPTPLRQDPWNDYYERLGELACKLDLDEDEEGEYRTLSALLKVHMELMAESAVPETGSVEALKGRYGVS
jgi:hypothetical protein